MTSILQDYPLLEAVQTTQGQAFSRYLPTLHLTPAPYRNGYKMGQYWGGSSLTRSPQTEAQTNAGNYRPWMNDPCRAIWDEEHGFWRAWVLSSNNPGQKHPTWIEVISPDMQSWVLNRAPIYTDNLDQPSLWGGCTVIDEKNTSDFGEGSVHYFISVPGGGGYDQQSVARFIAPGLGLAPVYDRIVLGNPGVGDVVHAPGMDFRDPRVDWDEGNSQWVMKLTVGYGIAFYRSTDLENWSLLSVLDLSAWQQIETPDLVPMTASDGSQKWVLLFSLKMWEGRPYSSVGYLVGQWDGTRFTPDYATPKLLNWGSDYYAQAVWQKNGQTYCWAWLGNWSYTIELPTQGFVGTQSLVTNLSLVKDDSGQWAIRQSLLPLQDRYYADYTTASQIMLSNERGGVTQWKPELANPGISWRVDLSLYRYTPLEWSDEIRFDLCSDGTHYTRLTLNPNAGTVTLSRSRSGDGPLDVNDNNAHTFWQQDRTAPLPYRMSYDITVVFDSCTLEILINGDVAMTSLIFPPETAFGMSLTHSGNGASYISSFKISY